MGYRGKGFTSPTPYCSSPPIAAPPTIACSLPPIASQTPCCSSPPVAAPTPCSLTPSSSAYAADYCWFFAAFCGLATGVCGIDTLCARHHNIQFLIVASVNVTLQPQVLSTSCISESTWQPCWREEGAVDFDAKHWRQEEEGITARSGTRHFNQSGSGHGQGCWQSHRPKKTKQHRGPMSKAMAAVPDRLSTRFFDTSSRIEKLETF